MCVDPQGNALSGSFSYKEDVPAFLDFLDGGLTQFKEGFDKKMQEIEETLYP